MDINRVKYFLIVLLGVGVLMPYSGFAQYEEKVSGLTVKILMQCNCENFHFDTDLLLLYDRVKTVETNILSRNYSIMVAKLNARDIPNCYVVTDTNKYGSILEINNHTDFNAILKEVINESDTIHLKNQIIERLFWFLTLYENQNFEYFYLTKEEYNYQCIDIRSSLIYHLSFSESKTIIYKDQVVQVQVIKKERITKGKLKGKYRYYDEILNVFFDERGMITKVVYE